MGVICSLHHHHHRHRHHQGALSFATVTALAFLLLAAVPVLGLNPSARQLSGFLREEKRSGGGGGGGGGEVNKASGLEILKRVLGQRLNGPGSSPPSCRSKCGKCTPCKPVHVPIQPGFSMPLEYYPEAWRCKCGNTVFMP